MAGAAGSRAPRASASRRCHDARRPARRGAMTLAVPLAFAAAVAAVLGAWEWLAVAERSRFAAALARIVEPVARAGRDGREPSRAERRRLAVLAAAALMAAGWLLGGAALAGPAPLCGPTSAVGLG